MDVWAMTAPAAPGTWFATAEAFYDADPRRGASRESDYGVMWRNYAGSDDWRAAWVHDTGELYACTAGGDRQVVVLAALDEAAVEYVLDGWAQQCGRTRSVVWLAERCGLPQQDWPLEWVPTRTG